ncbi:prevent-host-death protein [Bradyrhizobium sp. ARR65]|uniref:prevent-host-death protein n=1 Tax=Bradyrhizobium sp. ARR65 TaxID=1040989 RepID=UPI000A4B7C03|nr:prevent-host-death protein [Bradyrhizobium sp. ARR65]
MDDDPKQTSEQPAPHGGAGPTEGHQAAGRDRRVVRTAELSDQDSAAIEASKMEPGYEHLDAELDWPRLSLIERGLWFVNKLRHRGRDAGARPVSKAFRDGLYDDT